VPLLIVYLDVIKKLVIMSEKVFNINIGLLGHVDSGKTSLGKFRHSIPLMEQPKY